MLSQTNFYKKNKEEIVWGLAGGLAGGLVWGLIWGLIWGLVVGLIWGLIWGLVVGLVWGLVWGLAGGLAVVIVNFPQAFPFLCNFYPILFLILGIIAISEIMFLLMPKEKLRKGTNIFWHTCKRKAENIFEVLLSLSAISQVYILAREVQIRQYFPVILKWVGYIGVGLFILFVIGLVLYLWIKLNSLKYRR